MSSFTANKVYKMQDDFGNLIVSFVVSGNDKWTANMAIEELKKLNKIDVKANEHKSERSLAQNKMLWALCEKIAIATSGVKWKAEVEDCYCDLIESANVKSEFYVALPEAKKELEEQYRVVKEIGKRKIIDPRTNKETNGSLFVCYKGSSHFNTKQMTELIDFALHRCSELGINDSEIQAIREENQR